MDISRHMYIWIDEIVKENKDGTGTVFNGDTFDDEFGFGSDKRRYEGKCIQISQNGRMEGWGRIDMIHYLHRGLMWNISNISCFLQLPFVITDDFGLRHVFSGFIRLTPSANAEEVFAKYPDRNLAIISEHCIGNIHVNQEGFYLHVFSNSDLFECADILLEDFCFAGYTENIGKIEFIDTADNGTGQLFCRDEQYSCYRMKK